MTAHYFIQKVVKSTGFRKKSGIPCFFVLWMWINLREKNEKGSFSVASAYGHPYGASGAVLVLHALARLKETGGIWGLCAIAGAGGTGSGLLLRRV